MDDLERPLERRPELALQSDQLRQVGAGQPEADRRCLERRVEGAAVRDVHGDGAARRADRDVPGEDERRHVPEADGLDLAFVIEACLAGESAARHIHGHGDC